MGILWNRIGLRSSKEDEMPTHNHYLDIWADTGGESGFRGGSKNLSDTKHTKDSGGSQPHNNIQPYLVVYMWQRTA